MIAQSSRSVRSLVAFLSLSMTLVALGCGNDGLGKRYPVSGTVTYKGQPVAKGNISFYAAGGGNEAASRGAFGVIENGKYSLSTQATDDGAFPGEYMVAITARETDMSEVQKNAATSGSGRQDDVAQAYAAAKSLIPTKYEVPESSGLKATVEAKSNTLNFDLAE